MGMHTYGCTCGYNVSIGVARKVDEIWDFSHSNIEHCNGPLVLPPPTKGAPPERRHLTVRYVPPGFISSAQQVDGHSHALLFFGSIDATTGRSRCFYRLKRSLGAELQQTYSVWNDTGLERTLREHNLFLNIHKHCASGGPVTFRQSLFISHGKLILSDRAHPKDEAEYRGMMIFVELSQLESTYRRLVKNGYRTEQRLAHKRFRLRFQPDQIMRRANVYRDFSIPDVSRHRRTQ